MNNIFSFSISLQDKQVINEINNINLLHTSNKYIESMYEWNGVKITIYNSQKCVVQGKNAELFMQQYLSHYLENNTIKDNETYCSDNFKLNIMGSDEVGVGDYFGGLVVCVAFIPSNIAHKIQDLGVKDSKKLSDKQIIELAFKLKEIIRYQIIEINPKQYNDLFFSFKNAHVVKSVLHYHAIEKLYFDLQNENIIVDDIVIDQYANKDKFSAYLKQGYTSNKLDKEITFVTKAESKYLSVACASIIARYYFLEQVKQIEAQAQMKIYLGAWNENIEETTLKLLKNCEPNKNKIIDILQYYVKTHFSNTEKIISKLVY